MNRSVDSFGHVYNSLLKSSSLWEFLLLTHHGSSIEYLRSRVWRSADCHALQSTKNIYDECVTMKIPDRSCKVSTSVEYSASGYGLSIVECTAWDAIKVLSTPAPRILTGFVPVTVLISILCSKFGLLWIVSHLANPCASTEGPGWVDRVFVLNSSTVKTEDVPFLSGNNGFYGAVLYIHQSAHN